ncbi:phytoene desaturase family protein [Amnibacterium kyonggiense]|uniref:Phytoene dehydrogenase-like protein n=1 Tax=Amnibacterium kyonggiense TaxID=595671 RepID=A0A4R7FSZ2_9MICO|nr:NAD(P)/FAD-dependent oxidoreductase [Amnibacterium kyonggiense]TDS81005.1 phytoene dehydrogenase-like protein [Amnibacterium kyonggiense]
MSAPDVVVVGAGPNGLAAAVTAARAGLRVLVVEAADRPGGAARTEEVTLPGFRHDLGAAVHPMALASPFFRAFGLADRVPFRTPEASYAHPFDDGTAAIAWRDLDRTASGLGADGPAYRRLLGPLVDRADGVALFTLGPVLRVPRDPATAVRFGLATLDQGGPGWNARWRGREAPALLTGVMAHTVRPMPSLPSAGAGLALAVQAHAVGWPIPVGGTGAIADALVEDLVAHGGRIETGRTVADLRDLPAARATVLDTSVPALLAIAGRRLAPLVRAWLRTVRFGSGVGKVDFALDGPVPWLDPTARTAVTLHLGGPRAAVAAAEHEVARGRVPDRPYVLVAQPSVLDPTRAPQGKHVLWTYTHLPHGSTLDPTALITDAVERLAPGFRDLVLAANARSAADIGAWDANLGGGDIAAGAVTLRQLLARPVPTGDPWHLGDGLYLCSAAAAPGPGVHGQGGHLAARSFLRREFGIAEAPALR